MSASTQVSAIVNDVCAYLINDCQMELSDQERGVLVDELTGICAKHVKDTPKFRRAPAGAGGEATASAGGKRTRQPKAERSPSVPTKTAYQVYVAVRMPEVNASTVKTVGEDGKKTSNPKSSMTIIADEWKQFKTQPEQVEPYKAAADVYNNRVKAEKGDNEEWKSRTKEISELAKADMIQYLRDQGLIAEHSDVETVNTTVTATPVVAQTPVSAPAVVAPVSTPTVGKSRTLNRRS